MTTLHIQPADDATQSGAGTLTDPLRIHGPHHFDTLLSQIDDQSNTLREIVFHPGTYWTRGRWAIRNANVGRPMRFVSVYTEETVALNMPRIKLHPEAIFHDGVKPRKDTGLPRFGVAHRNNNQERWHFAGLAFDGNESAFPKDKFITGAIDVWGIGTAEDFVIQGLRGQRPEPGDTKEENHLEAFACSFKNHVNGDHGVDGGNIIRRGIIYDNGDTNPYFSGPYSGVTRYKNAVAPSLIQDVEVIGVGQTPSRGIIVSVQANTHVINVFGRHMTYGVYNDTRAVENCLIQGCEFHVVYCGMALLAGTKFETDVPHKRDVIVRDSKFFFTPQDGRESILLWLGGPHPTAEFSNIRMENVTAAYESNQLAAVQRPFVGYSLDTPNAMGVSINGTLPAGWREHITAKAGMSKVKVTEEKKGNE